MAKTRSITFRNDFHHTTVTLRVSGDTLSARQVRRAWKALCGIADCHCSDVLGARGQQEVYHGRLDPQTHEMPIWEPVECRECGCELDDDGDLCDDCANRLDAIVRREHAYDMEMERRTDEYIDRKRGIED